MGSCSYGDKCRYSHIKFTKSKEESTNINRRSKEPDTRFSLPPSIPPSLPLSLSLSIISVSIVHVLLYISYL